MSLLAKWAATRPTRRAPPARALLMTALPWPMTPRPPGRHTDPGGVAHHPPKEAGYSNGRQHTDQPPVQHAECREPKVLGTRGGPKWARTSLTGLPPALRSGTFNAVEATMCSDGLEVWFLTGSQELYGEATLRQVDVQSREIVALLNSGPEIEVPIVWKPVLTSAEGIRGACLDANSSDTCIGLVVWMHTFSPAKAWIAGLDLLRKPLLHLHTQANLSLPWAEIDMDFMNLNQAAHGDREFGYIQTRLALRRKTIAGHASNPLVRQRIGSWARAATGC